MAEPMEPGPLLDAKVAERIMGWPEWAGDWAPRPDASCYWYPDPCGDLRLVRDSRVEVWSPSTDWRAAGEVWDKMAESHSFNAITNGAADEVHVTFSSQRMDAAELWREGKTVPHAICLAALAAAEEPCDKQS